MCFPSIHKQGYPFIGIAFLLSCAGFSISFGLGVVFLFATVLFVLFFRDPERVIPSNDALIVSPADGVVTSISEVESPIGQGTMVTRVGIFLSVLDVHVNRVPVSGVVKSVEYRPGKFSPAYTDGACHDKEMVRTVIESSVGTRGIVVEQIAGVIARRIVCDLKAEGHAQLGVRMGIIRFGSRMNVYVPSDMPIFVTEGQTVVAGETIISDLSARQQQPAGQKAEKTKA